MDKSFIGFCGMDCESCKARLASVNSDDRLREETAREWSKIYGSPEIVPETICCCGCRKEGVKFYFCGQLCEIRKCAIAKGFETCADCPELGSCRMIAEFHQHSPELKKNLELVEA